MLDYHLNSKAPKLRFKRKKSKKLLLLLILLLFLGTGYLAVTSGILTPSLALKKRLLPEPAPQSQQTPTLPESDLADFRPLPEDQHPEDAWHLGPVSSTSEKILTLSAGDTLIDILLQAGLNRSEAHEVIDSLQEIINPRKLRQGQELTLAFTEKMQYKKFQGLKIELDVERELQVVRNADGILSPREVSRDLQIRPAVAEASINSSLYQAALDAGLPIQVLIQIIRAYSYDIDFQRDIQPGDKIEVMYEEKVDAQGQFLEAGSALYASLWTRGRKMPIYRYQTLDGETDFYDPQGKSVRKTLMVTPIDGARLSSNYGMRRHPILGYNKMHHGLDFAAPTGTPIMAAGDGVVEYAGRKGSYGHYIRIRHPNQYHTVYAHLTRYARGLKKGVRVKQGETIGYVGSTGRSTGPHLHYEVHHRGQHVNPAQVKTPPGRTLKGEELQGFMLARANLEKRYAALREDTLLAQKDRDKPREVTKQ